MRLSTDDVLCDSFVVNRQSSSNVFSVISISVSNVGGGYNDFRYTWIRCDN